jgi:hypothetical protein
MISFGKTNRFGLVSSCDFTSDRKSEVSRAGRFALFLGWGFCRYKPVVYGCKGVRKQPFSEFAVFSVASTDSVHLFTFNNRISLSLP